MRDKADFDRMFHEWYPQFVYFAYYFIADMESSRDIASDAFEYLWRNYEKIEEETARNYLYAFVRTRCIDFLRKQNVNREYTELMIEQANRLTEREERQGDPRIARIYKAMEKLTPYNRHILHACYIDKKSYKEVAEELKVSVAAIHKNIVKALRTLREELTPEG